MMWYADRIYVHFYKHTHFVAQNEEENFLEALWGFFRSGKQPSAAEFCTRNGQAWRAVTLLGGALFSILSLPS